ncbi:SOS response-associated peptidase family protein [Subtercola vilae]|uniref:Uncharacterized protein n=1 Tax=Subtercola vilae TaxID=2056433 RepID=A0A4T2BZL1_9MICO|nr:SOS response-associated peptidase family protein [Subtercola vilae]TIH37097.1 hypothetical protein D4765_08725 [Subtercola vilae]
MLTSFALTPSAETVAALFGAARSRGMGWRPSSWFQPKRKILIVRSFGDAGAREVITASWGFVPAWHDGELEPLSQVGIRRVETNGLFRDALRHGRCLIPMSAPAVPGALPDALGSAPVVAAAALASIRLVDGHERVSVALLTAEAAAGTGERHGLPALLDTAGRAAWLDPHASTAGALAGLRAAVSH